MNLLFHSLQVVGGPFGGGFSLLLITIGLPLYSLWANHERERKNIRSVMKFYLLLGAGFGSFTIAAGLIHKELGYLARTAFIMMIALIATAVLYQWSQRYPE